MFPARFSSGFSGRGARDADFRQGELAQQGGSGMGLKGPMGPIGSFRAWAPQGTTAPTEPRPTCPANSADPADPAKPADLADPAELRCYPLPNRPRAICGKIPNSKIRITITPM